ncbi:MAG: hypothetical protein SFY80_05180 [Verrucomicrobiota bacterium]|nr:hypothetical protein [Verrucomicrobiota bacterium]
MSPVIGFVIQDHVHPPYYPYRPHHEADLKLIQVYRSVVLAKHDVSAPIERFFVENRIVLFLAVHDFGLSANIHVYVHRDISPQCDSAQA